LIFLIFPDYSKIYIRRRTKSAKGDKVKKKSIPLVIVLFVCSTFFNVGPRTLPNLNIQTGYITVHGHYEYWDNNGALRPTVFGRVRIFDADPAGLRRLTDVNGNNEYFTDANGNFTSGLILNSDPADGGGLDIVVLIYTWNSAVAVTDGTGTIYDFGWGTWYNVTDGSRVDFSLSGVPQDQIGAWIVFSYHCGIVAGWNYVKTQTGYETPMVTARWPYGNWPQYWTNGTIDLPDWACWWPDTILHEYGHHVMNSLYGFIPPSMLQHYINLRSNSTTAWAEGWANFFPLAVFNKGNLVLGINATTGKSIDLEAPTWYTSGWDNGDEVEGRVAGALLDIYDSHNDGYDTFSDGFTHIWNIMHTTPCNTFQEFWQAWNTSGYPKQPALMAIFQNTVDYRGRGDCNADGIVDIYDSNILSAAFGSKHGDSNWDQRADLNYDGVIDIYDALILSHNFNHHYDC